ERMYYENISKFMSMSIDEKDRAIQEIVDKEIKIDSDKKVTYTIVGIIETDPSDKLLGNKIVRLLTENEKANKDYTFEAFAYLKDSSETKLSSMANDLGIKFIPKGPYPEGYPGSDVRFTGYDKASYSSIIRNGVSRNILLVIMAFCFMAVYNTFHSSVAKRIKVYGILRAVGGNMRQISYLIYSEAVLLFLVATPIGLLIGYLLTRLESYVLINVMGLLDTFIMNFNLELILITLISTLIIVGISVKSVLRKEGKLTPIEAVMDARGLTRNKKTFGKNLLGQSLTEGDNGEEDNKAIKELLDYDKKTFKFKIMKNLFKFEGELAHKNITRDAKPHKLTKSTLFMAMAILIFFFLQVVNGSVKAGNIVKSDKWDVELSLNKGQFDNKVIDEIKKVDGVENVYRWSETKLPIVVSNDYISEGLKKSLANSPVEKIDEENKTQGIVASLTTLDENSLKLYNGIDKESLDNGGVLLVSKGTSYIGIVSHMSGGGINYSYINSNPTLLYNAGDKLLVSQDETVLNKEGLEDYYKENKDFNELNIVDTVEDDKIFSTANSINMNELDFNVKLLTTEEGFKKIVGGTTNNKLVIKTSNVEKRVDTIKELNKICAVNNYSLNDVVGSKLTLERNIKQDLGLNI
ncbi:MAG: ABC transporter permease, partial [Clostridium sp.]